MSIQHSAINLLGQLQGVVDQFTKVTFSKSLGVLSDNSIGQHVRHTLEFFICLMDAAPSGVVNYDNRQHDACLEKDPSLAHDLIDSVCAFLQEHVHDSSLTLVANYEIASNETTTIPSNFLRELAYNIEHTIHHMALIKIGIHAEFPDVAVPDHFGVASSTIRYQKSHNA